MNKFVLFFLLLPLYGAETWKTVQITKSPAGRVCGLAFDGRYLWHGESNGPGRLYKTDIKSGRKISQVNTKMYDPGDIEWLDGAIWVTEENRIPFADGISRNCVKKINPSTGITIDSIIIDVPAAHPGGQCEAVTTDGRLLYISYFGRWLITVDPVQRKTVKIMDVEWANQDLTGNSYYLDGLTWAFGHIFAVTNTPLSINEIDPATGKKLAEFKAPEGEGWGPEGLATDGSSIYYSEYTNGRAYKIMLIDGYFR